MIRTSCMLDVSKHELTHDAIIRLISSMLNSNPLVQIAEVPFSIDTWIHENSKLQAKNIRMYHSFVKENRSLSLHVFWGIYEVQLQGNTMQEVCLETYDATKVDIVEWLYERRAYLMVSESQVGWDHDEQKFV